MRKNFYYFIVFEIDDGTMCIFELSEFLDSNQAMPMDGIRVFLCWRRIFGDERRLNETDIMMQMDDILEINPQIKVYMVEFSYS